MASPMPGLPEGGMMDETPMQRCLRLARENGYYGRFNLPDPEEKVDFIIQPRREKDADA